MQKTDMSRMQANKEEIDATGDDYAANEKDYFDPSGGTAVKQEPIKVGPKIGRNDPCPCELLQPLEPFSAPSVQGQQQPVIGVGHHNLIG
jgi:hypothetical protein